MATAMGVSVGAMTAGIGLLVVAIAGITAGLIAWGVSSDKTWQKINAEKEELKKNKEQIEQNIQAWEQLKQTQQENIDAGMTEISYYQSLYDELQKLVDENGKIKEGYEGRAKFITTTLRDALGIEVDAVGGVITGYNNLKDTFDKVIEKKKAMIILDAQEESYKQALLDRANVLKSLNQLEDDMAESFRGQKEEYDLFLQALRAGNAVEATIHYNKGQEYVKMYNQQKELYEKQEQTLMEYNYNIDQYEKNASLAHEERYSEMTNVNWEYVKDYQNSADQKKAILEQEIRDEKKNLEILRKQAKESNDGRYDDEIKASEKRLTNLANEMKNYVSTTEDGLNKANITWNDELDNQISAISGRNVEFRDAGDGNVQMYVDGIASGDARSKEQMAQIVSNAIAEVNNRKPQSTEAGENLVEGVSNGIENRQGSAFGIIWTFGSLLLSNLKDSLKEESPSKATKEMGQFLAEGLIIGVKNEEKNVGKSAEEMAQLFISSATKRLKQLKTIDQYTIYEEIGMWQRILKETEEGTDAYYDVLEKLNDAKQSLLEKKQAYINESTKLTTDYITNLNKIEEEYTTQSSKLWEEYESKVKSRAESILSTFDMFDEVKLEDKVSKTQIFTNLETQIGTLERWDDTLDDLKKRIQDIAGVEGDNLYTFLESQGVKSLESLQSVTSMTDDELKKLVELYNRKEDIAYKRARQEYEGLYQETIQAVDKLRETADKQIEELKAEYHAGLKKIAEQCKQDGIQAGWQLVKGIRQGMNEQMDVLENETRKRLQALVNEIKASMEIHSPSKVWHDEIGVNLGLGLANGIFDSLKNIGQNVSKVLSTEANLIDTDIPRISGSTTTNNQIVVNFYPQEMTEGELDKAFNYINRRFGTAY